MADAIWNNRFILADPGKNETVLWQSSSGSGTTDTSCTLSEAWTNFDSIDIWYKTNDGAIYKETLSSRGNPGRFMLMSSNYNGTNWFMRPCRYNISGTTISADVGAQYTFTTNSVSRTLTDVLCYLYKVVGINRISGGN